MANIAGKTIRAMEQQFGVSASDIWVGIGPSICGTCYEIDANLAEQFQNQFTPTILTDALFLQEQEGSQAWHLDLWKLNHALLLQAGVPEQQIITGNVCTCHEPMNRYLFSHRATQGRRGGMAGMIMLNVNPT